MALYDDRIFTATYTELVKYYALIAVVLIGSALPIRPIAEQKDTYADVLQVLLLLYLLTGWLWPGANGVVAGRVKGFLPNPNGFALTAMMLLLLIGDSSGKLRKGLAHVVVIGLIYVSRTSGAIIGYAAGVLYSLTYRAKARNMPLRIAGVLIVVSLAANIFLSLPPKTFKPVDLIVKKLALVKENWRAIAEDKPISYYDIVSEEGEDVTSGMWRLKHWARILKTFVHGDLLDVAFGYGIGTTDLIFKLKSHNDYLRILFETGILGFVANACLWLILFRRMDKRYRWAPVMVAVYCMTENNYDHFPAMSLLAFYMLSRRTGPARLGDRVSTPDRSNSSSTQGVTVQPHSAA